jgi:D-amino-acid dehydrogenase
LGVAGPLAAPRAAFMKILVLGAGVIGTTAAYALAHDGHEVIVLDRQPGVARETSFANAGEVSPGYSAPWAGPGVPIKAVKWLLMHHRPLVVRTPWNPTLISWALQMLRNCTQARYELNKRRMVRLAEYSRDCMIDLRARTGITYDERMQGTLQLFRTQAQLDGAQADIDVLQRDGVKWELLDRDGCVQHEPALRHTRNKFVGGLRLPGDETGDCQLFSEGMFMRAQVLGATFRLGVTVEGLVHEGRQVTGVRLLGGETVKADAVLLALGSHSTAMLAPLGLRIPVYPVKGYSITVPITDATRAPESTVMDETHKVAVTRLGSRIRVGGTAELAGFDLRLHERRRHTLEHVVTDLFPDAGDVGKASFWCGLRPMTPDGTPIVGATPWKGLYLATGHGTLGWTMAAGTARVVADVIAGRKPGVDLDGLGLERYA